MRGIIQVQEGVYYEPISKFRQKLLNDKLAFGAPAKDDDRAKYYSELSSEEAQKAFYEKIELRNQALEASDEERSDDEQWADNTLTPERRTALYRNDRSEQ